MASHSNILYFDPCSQVRLSYDSKEFISDATPSKTSFISSRILYDDLTSHSFKVPKESSKEEIHSLVELKMYEEAGLDLQKEYKMAYVIKELEFDEMLLVESFAVEKTKVTNRLKDVLDAVEYIDFLAIPFLAFSTLYKNKIIATKNDVFIYIEENEAFMSIYKDGHFLATKSLLTLNDMLQSLKKNDIDIQMDSLVEILQTKGLDASLYVKEEVALFTALEGIFAELFTKINNVIIHSRSIFGFEKIDRLFFSTHFGRIKGLKETGLNFFSPDLRLMDFNLFKQKVENNFFERIVASYAYDVSQAESIEQDITFFPKQPPFFKTIAGQFIGFVSLVFILLALFSGYLAYDISALQKQDTLVSNQLNLANENAKKIRGNLQKVQSEIALQKNEAQEQASRMQKISRSVSELYRLRTNQQSTMQFLYTVNQVLAKYNLLTKSITISDNDNMKVEVLTSFSSRDRIAKFMQDLITFGFIGVTTEEIKLDNEIYISVVEISK